VFFVFPVVWPSCISPSHNACTGRPGAIVSILPVQSFRTGDSDKTVTIDCITTISFFVLQKFLSLSGRALLSWTLNNDIYNSLLLLYFGLLTYMVQIRRPNFYYKWILVSIYAIRKCSWPSQVYLTGKSNYALVSLQSHSYSGARRFSTNKKIVTKERTNLEPENSNVVKLIEDELSHLRVEFHMCQYYSYFAMWCKINTPKY